MLGGGTMVRLIDTQGIMPKSVEVSKINHEESKHSEMQQQEFAKHLAKEIEAKQQQVNASDKSSDESNVDKDGKNGGSEYKKNKDRSHKHKSQKDAEEKKKKKNVSMFDVTI